MAVRQFLGLGGANFALYTLWLPEQYPTSCRASAFAFATSVGRFGGAGSDYGMAVAVDATGAVLVSGRFEDSIELGGPALLAPEGSQDAFLLELSPDGAHVWSRRFGGPGADQSYAVAAFFPSPLSAQSSTGPVCSVKLASCLPLVASQTFAVLSRLHVRIFFPSPL